MEKIDLSEIIGFEWDKGNKNKNKNKHNVEASEAEEAIDNDPVFIYDALHSQKEERYIALGITDERRFLFVSFTIRKKKIRVISARDQDKKEKTYYQTNRKGGKIYEKS